MIRINPYLNFDGECKAAFEFYQEVLGGEIVAMHTAENTPAFDGDAAQWQGRILHARLIIGDQVLMGSDSPPEYFQKSQGLFVTLNVDDLGQAKRLFDALAENGSVQMPFEKTFWAKGFGMLVDRFGTPWMVNCEEEKSND